MKKQGADVIGAKAGAKPKKPYIQKDTIGSTQNAEIVYGIGDGENGGLINGLNSIILDGTRVIGSSGEVNFNEVKYEERFGLIDQPPLKLIEDTITERGLSLEVRSASPVVSSFNNRDVDKFVVRISVPSLMLNKDNGDSVATSVTYAIDISVDGGAYQTVAEATIFEKITNGYETDHEIDAPDGLQRTIRVRRITPDSTSQLVVDKLYVAAISEVINAKFSHPTLHHIGLVFNAEQFNNIPKVVFHYYGRKIKVPVNYNPTTRQYDGIWNGTFKVVYSNNPAWVLFDILTDRRSGLGRRIPVELVDKWELYRIAQYCDELVPDGDGGMEPRFVCNNLVLNSKQDAYQVLKDIASIFRGQSFWNGSQVVTVADAPRDIDYAISMASVISYSYSGTARNARHNVVKVQYYDKNNENAAAYEYATDYDSIRETEQINEVEIRAFGCTSAGQAQRLARYTLLSEQTETRILTAKLSMDAFVNMQIGDVFAWSDKFLAGANNGGRVVAVNGAELTLDRDVTDSALVGDTLFVNTTSGKASTRTITAINGNKVTLDDVLATTEPEFVWVIDSADLSLLYFKLDDYKVNPAEGTVDIVGIQHVNGKFGTIDTETSLEAPPFSKVEIETLRAPGNVTTNYNVRVDQGLNIADLYVAWGQVKGATRYTVEFRRDDQAWRILGTVTGLTHTIENVSAGIYEVRVRAADAIGNLSPYGFASPINVAGVVLPPPKLTYFAAEGRLLAIATKWTFPAGTEASLAVVIEHATQDPTNVGVPTQKLNIPYPQTEYVFNGLGAHTQMWFRAAIVDKYNQEGEFTAWTTATADANPEELIDLISGHISEGTLDQTLKGKIDGAGALAGEAQTLANQAKADAANAATAAANAATKAQEAANAAAKEATDRAAALTAQATTLKADSASKVAALKAEVDPKITTLQNGITQVTTDYKAADTAVVGQINAYKTSNDSAVASVLQKAESAVATGATNSSAITAINGQISTINGALSTKLDASVIAGYYTKGQTDAKAAEISAGKIEEFSATLVSGGRNYATKLQNGEDFKIFSGSVVTVTPNLARPLMPLTLPVTNPFRVKITGGTSSVISSSSITFIKESSVFIGFKVKNEGSELLRFDFTSLFNIEYLKGSDIISAGEEKEILLRGTTAANATVSLRVLNPHKTVGGAYTEVSFLMAEVMAGVGTVPSNWIEPAEAIKSLIDANSTAIQNTTAEVTRVDGVATAANNATTALAGRVSTVEGAVSTKAEAAALTALTTRVGNAEGVNTSQGSAITTLQNTVNHATTGLATKASTSALTATNSEVSRVNGLVTGHTNQLTQLASDITTINGTLATKANASALNDIYTKTQADAKATEIAAGEVSKFSASISNEQLQELLVDGNNPAYSDGSLYQAAGFTMKEAREVGATYTLRFKMSINRGGNDTTSYIRAYQGGNAALLRNYTEADGTIFEVTFTATASSPDNEIRFYHFPNSPAAKAGTSVTIHWASLVKAKDDAKAQTQAALDANSTAIQNTNAEVARVDGRVTTESDRTTTLTGRVSTVEGAVSTKADASALNSLTTRVATEEGKSTSQGTAITALQNTVNHATTGLATKASSAALTTVDNRVTTVDGRVNTTNSNVATLTGRVSTVEGAVATKADVSAMNALTTRVGNVEGGLSTQASNTLSLSAKIDSRAESASLIPDYLLRNKDEWRSHYGYDLTPYFTTVTDGKIGNTVFRKPANVASCWNYSRTAVPNDRVYKLSMWVRRAVGSAGAVYFTCNPIGNDGVHDTENSYVGVAVPATNVWTYVEQVWNLTGRKDDAPQLAFGFAINHAVTGAIAEVQGFKVEAVISIADTDSTLASAAALTTTDTEVSRINGVVSGHTTQLSNLTASIAGKAATSALNALTVRVTEEERKSTSQATSITDLNSSLTTIKRDNLLSEFLDATGGGANYLQVSIPLKQNTYIALGRKITVKGKLSFKHTGTLTASQGLRIFLGGNLSFNDIELIKQGDDYYFDTMLEANRELTFNALNFYFMPNGTANSSTQTTVHWAELYFGDQTSKVDLSGYATASAVTALTTRVTTAEGKISTEATKLTNLSTTVGGHTTTINSQTTSINGIRGVHAMKFDTNGVISGYGLISELVNGTVKSQFGINANNFFIGAPSSKKKPFIVYTSPGTINGVTVPAGTYIDTAFIGAATIGTAHIRDLNVTTGKIANLAVTTAKIGNLQVDTLKIKDNAVTVPAGYTNPTSVTKTDNRSPTVHTGGNAVLLDNSVYFGDVASITIQRAGGKCRIEGSIAIEDFGGSVWTADHKVVTNGPSGMYIGIVLLRNGTPIGYYKTTVNKTIQNQTAWFNGSVDMPIHIDDAFTGTATYAIRVGLSCSMTGGILISNVTGRGAKMMQASIAVLELKK